MHATEIYVSNSFTLSFASVATARFVMPSWTGLTVALTWRALRNPRLASALVRVAWRFRRREWYKRPPFLPLPSAEYVRWRMYTAYGSENFVPPADDVVRYARWAVDEP
jgi:hypothetical protein